MGPVSSRRWRAQQVEEEQVPAPPLLLRQGSASSIKTCKICLAEKRKGIVCEQCHESLDHFVCRDCFSPYVDSVISNPGKLTDDAFVMRCPMPACTSRAWTSHEIRLVLEGAVLDRYVDSLVAALGSTSGKGPGTAGGEVSKTVHAVVNALNIACPSCAISLDPNPDGCAALRCGGCGVHFCWLCLRVCDSSNSCHRHVAQCSSNPSRRVFPPKSVKDKAHLGLRIIAVRRQLESAFGVNWRDDAAARDAVELATPVLKQSLLTTHDIFAQHTLSSEAQSRAEKSSFLSFWGGVVVATVVLSAAPYVLSVSMSGAGGGEWALESPNKNYSWSSIQFRDVLMYLFKSTLVGIGFYKLTGDKNLALGMSIMWYLYLQLFLAILYILWWILCHILYKAFILVLFAGAFGLYYKWATTVRQGRP